MNDDNTKQGLYCEVEGRAMDVWCGHTSHFTSHREVSGTQILALSRPLSSPLRFYDDQLCDMKSFETILKWAMKSQLSTRL